jgi:hypothetical protein
MNFKNILISKTARIIYLAILIFLSSLLFKQITVESSFEWYILIALNLILLMATARWLRKTDT